MPLLERGDRLYGAGPSQRRVCHGIPVDPLFCEMKRALVPPVVWLQLAVQRKDKWNPGLPGSASRVPLRRQPSSMQVKKLRSVTFGDRPDLITQGATPAPWMSEGLRAYVCQACASRRRKWITPDRQYLHVQTHLHAMPRKLIDHDRDTSGLGLVRLGDMDNPHSSDTT